MNEWIKRAWRWLTLADMPSAYGPTGGGCDFCDGRAVCTVWINEKSWRTCMEHMRIPQEMTFPQ